MSRPPGPPPYTAEEIVLLDTPTARFIAQAELNSYIVGHRLADLREQGLLSTQPTYTLTNSGAPTSTLCSSSPLLSDTPPDLDSNEDYQSSLGGDTGGPRHREPRNRRGNGGHQPYPSPHHARSRHAERPTASNGTISRNNRSIKPKAPCQSFTSTGKCARLRCPDLHDVDKLALCKRFLYKNACAKGALCSLSHQTTLNNTPHCLYFLENRCTNSTCMFLHLDIDVTTSVCGSFGKLGYCSKGRDCSDLHVYECPDFANEGACATGEHCPLRHIHYASRMKAAAYFSGPATPQSSTNTEDSGDMREANHPITQQHDYVAFGSED